MLGFLMATQDDLGAGLAVASEYVDANVGGLSLALVPHDDLLVVEASTAPDCCPESTRACDLLIDLALWWLCATLQTVGPRHWWPVWVGVEPHRDLSRVQARFPGQRLVHREVPGLAITVEVARTPMRHQHQAMADYFDDAMERVAQAHDDRDDALTPVRRAIVCRMADGARLDDVAREVGRSPRALQRLLAEHGTSFQQVHDEVRRVVATSALVAGSTTGDVARLVGYADPRALRQAFERWTGLSPTGWLDLVRHSPDQASPRVADPCAKGQVPGGRHSEGP